MQKENLIKLNIRQKASAALILLLMVIALSAMFLLNADGKALLAAPDKAAAVLAALLLLTFGLFLYLCNFAKRCVAEIKYMYMIFLLLVICFQLNVIFSQPVMIYMRPVLTLCMLVTLLIGWKEGILFNFYQMLVLYLFDVYAGGFVFKDAAALYCAFNMLASGTYAVIYADRNKQRFNTVLSAFRLGTLSMLVGAAIYVLVEGIDTAALIVAAFSFLSTVISVLLYLGMLPLFELAFNIVTPYRLNELTDHNRDLLKQLAEKAPGTFNHCLSVSILAEACAVAIGENAQMARAAAYYHDIGKIKNPLYFKENQTDYDPHEDLTPELSANFIRKHAIEGFNICRKHRLPDEIAYICLEHHGTTIIKYFYAQAKKFTEGDLSTQQFKYHGPKPRSKIAVIIMIADAAEATLRAMEDRSRENVEARMQEIIDERMVLEQFSDCDITMKDLSTIKDTIVKISANIYHDRTEYPSVKFPAQGEEGEK